MVGSASASDQNTAKSAFSPSAVASWSPLSMLVGTFQTVSPRSTLAIEPHGKAHLFAFLGCPLDLSRVGVGARPAKSHRCLHRPNSPPLWCLRGGVGGDGTRDGGPRENGCRTQPTGL